MEAAKKQLLLLDAEAEGARIRAAAVTEAAQGVATSTSRQQAALEEQRAALGELLRQLEAREDGVAAAEADLEGLRAALGAQQVGGGGAQAVEGQGRVWGTVKGWPSRLAAAAGSTLPPCRGAHVLCVFGCNVSLLCGVSCCQGVDREAYCVLGCCGACRRRWRGVRPRWQRLPRRARRRRPGWRGRRRRCGRQRG